MQLKQIKTYFNDFFAFIFGFITFNFLQQGIGAVGNRSIATGLQHWFINRYFLRIDVIPSFVCDFPMVYKKKLKPVQKTRK